MGSTRKEIEELENRINQEVEKLKQQQLINSILQRKQSEIDALVQAAKTTSGPTSDIIKMQHQILKDNLERQNIENQKKLEEKRKEVIYDEVDKELQKMKEEDAIAAEKRKKKVDEIINELYYKDKSEKKGNVNKQEKHEKQSSTVEANKTDITKKEENNPIEHKNSNNATKEEKIRRIFEQFSVPKIKRVDIKSNLEENEQKSDNKSLQPIKKVTKRELGIRRTAIQAYERVMNFFQENIHTFKKGMNTSSTFSTTIPNNDIKDKETENTEKTKVKSFKEIYDYKQVSHARAMRMAELKQKQKIVQLNEEKGKKYKSLGRTA